MKIRVCLVGAGLTSATIAVELRRHLGRKVSLECFEARSHAGGNCHTTLQNGIWVHEYGPHVFHTDDVDVWDFVNSFVEFYPYTHRVKACTEIGTVALPVNLSTLSHIFRRPISPTEFQALVNSSAPSEGKSLGEYGRTVFGDEVFDLLFRGYTEKQWGRSVDELPASVLARLPVRGNFDDNYFDHPFQGIPRGGYTNLIETMFATSETEVFLDHRVDREFITDFDFVFWGGPLDAFFNHQAGMLPYRSIRFEKVESDSLVQGCAQMNYPSEKVPWTRVTEHKFFAEHGVSDDGPSVSFKEFSFETKLGDEPFYPIHLFGGTEKLVEYNNLARSVDAKVRFVGRLGKFAYLDMDKAIKSAMIDAKEFCASLR